VSPAVPCHPFGFGLAILCDIEEEDAREEENDQKTSECRGHVVVCGGVAV